MKTLHNNGTHFSDSLLAARFDDLANRFEDYYNSNKTRLNFRRTGVGQDDCGTTACHGGWGAVILMDSRDYYLRDDDFHDKELCYTSTQQRISFNDGANKIAQFLGFAGRGEMERWADQNPDFWLNRHGRSMFSEYGYKAFGYEWTFDINLSHIIAHYRAIAANLRKGRFRRWWDRVVQRFLTE